MPSPKLKDKEFVCLACGRKRPSSFKVKGVEGICRKCYAR